MLKVTIQTFIIFVFPGLVLFSSTKLSGTDLYKPSSHSVAFDDYQPNIPVQYISGVKIYRRWYKSKFLVYGKFLSH